MYAPIDSNGRTMLPRRRPSGNVTQFSFGSCSSAYSRMFLAAHELGCVRPIAYISALSQGRPVLRRGEGGEEREETLGEEADSDFFILLRAFQYAVKNNFASQACRRLGINALAAREAAQLAGQFLEIARDMKLDPRKEASDEAIRKSILAGFPDQVARRCEPGTLRCQLVHGSAAISEDGI